MVVEERVAKDGGVAIYVVELDAVGQFVVFRVRVASTSVNKAVASVASSGVYAAAASS